MLLMMAGGRTGAGAGGNTVGGKVYIIRVLQGVDHD